jgi:hypothetical protein
VLATLVVFAAAPLAAQDAVPFDAIGDGEARSAIRTLIADAAARGLPTAPLVTKVREGLAKHAAPDRIRVATAALVDRLQTAAAALAPSRTPEELAAAADALQAGIPVTTLRDMRKLWPAKPLTVPLGVLSEMVANGVSHASATRRVRELLVRGATTAQLASLGTNVQADIAAGLAPDAAMELRSKGVLSLLLNNAAANANTLAPAAPGVGTGGVGSSGATPPIRPPVKK